MGCRAKTGGDCGTIKELTGNSLKLEVMQKVPELVVHERMSQGKRVKGLKEKMKVPGWSMDEMKEKPQCWCGGKH